MEQRGKRLKTETGYELFVRAPAGDSEVRQKRRLRADLFRSGVGEEDRERGRAEDDCFLA